MSDPLREQVGGDHYKRLRIQPIEFILANGLGFVEGAVVKYVSRWQFKGGVQDLEKAKHFLDLLIQHEAGRISTKELATEAARAMGG